MLNVIQGLKQIRLDLYAHGNVCAAARAGEVQHLAACLIGAHWKRAESWRHATITFIHWPFFFSCSVVFAVHFNVWNPHSIVPFLFRHPYHTHDSHTFTSSTHPLSPLTVIFTFWGHSVQRSQRVPIGHLHSYQDMDFNEIVIPSRKKS